MNEYIVLRQASTNMEKYSFTIKPVPPFRLDLTVWALRRRAHNIVDQFDGEIYRRAWKKDSIVYLIEVSQLTGRDNPLIEVTVSSQKRLSNIHIDSIRATLEKVLNINYDLSDFYHSIVKIEKFSSFIMPFRGIKPPRFPGIYEAVINGVACQQLSLNVGIILLNRLIAACGPSWRSGQEVFHGFAEADKIAEMNPSELRNMGYSGSKAKALIGFSREVVLGNFDPESINDLDDGAVINTISRFFGLGRWTAEYVLLRGLGRTHIFPGDDIGARKNLQRWLGIDSIEGYSDVGSIMERFSPYQGLIYFHLLLNSLVEKGFVNLKKEV